MLTFDNKIKDINIILSRATKFYSRIPIEESIKIVSLVYLIRYFDIIKEEKGKNLNEIFKACSLLAYKFLMDSELINNFNIYEEEICKKINWNLFVDFETYNNYSELLSSSIVSKDSRCSRIFSSIVTPLGPGSCKTTSFVSIS